MTEKQIESFFVDSSNVNAEFMQHVNAMKPVESQPEGKSFYLPLDGPKIKLLREIAKRASIGKKAFVVVTTEAGFEVMRLPDGTDTELFYRYLEKVEEPSGEKGSGKKYIVQLIDRYADKSFSDLSKTELESTNKKMKDANVFSYSMIQRACVGLAFFRHADGGATPAIKKALVELVDDGFLEILPRSQSSSIFESNAVLYKRKSDKAIVLPIGPQSTANPAAPPVGFRPEDGFMAPTDD